MKGQDNISETLNNLNGLTLGHALKIVKRLKISALISIISIIASLMTGAYLFGRSRQQKQTAVMLQKPFSMRLEVEGKQVDYQKLILLKDPMLVSASKDTVIYSLREIKDEFDITPVGKIVATVEKTELSWPWSMFAISITKQAMASDGFNWNGHKEDLNYTEEFIDQETIHRTYGDGCVLEYKVNTDRKSLRPSFKWIKSVHG